MVFEKSSNDKVILLPKTIDYYQEELTRMLETERFSEAIELLTFLLECRSDDPQTSDEWHTLLAWLQSSFSSLTEHEGGSDEEDVEITEQDLHKQRFYSKMSEDPGYVKKLLETLLSNPDLEQKMIALEQLAVAEHPNIDDTLKRWVEQVELHPLVQYKVLQTLRARGATGLVHLNRGGEQIELDIAETPLDMIHYAPRIQEVMDRVRAVSEQEHPSLVFFADHMWKEFLAFIYGTSIYKSLIAMEEDETDVWAAALHNAVVESMNGNIHKEDVLDFYQIPEGASTRCEQHREQIAAFIRHTFLP